MPLQKAQNAVKKTRFYELAMKCWSSTLRFFIVPNRKAADLNYKSALQPACGQLGQFHVHVENMVEARPGKRARKLRLTSLRLTLVFVLSRAYHLYVNRLKPQLKGGRIGPQGVVIPLGVYE